MKMIPTGMAVHIPRGYGGHVVTKAERGSRETNCVVISGAIDAENRASSELRIRMCNHGRKIEKIRPRMAIAQMIIYAIHPATEVTVVD